MAVLLSALFLCISHTDIQLLIVMIVDADNTCEISVLWMRYSTLEVSFIMKYKYEIPLLHSFRCLRCLFRVFGMFEKFVSCL